jgi:hypothetical protein
VCWTKGAARGVKDAEVNRRNRFLFADVAGSLPVNVKVSVAIITDVEGHQVAGDDVASDNTNYDVSVKVGDTIYVVLQQELLRVLGLRCRSSAFYWHLQRPPQHVEYSNQLRRHFRDRYV